MQRPALSLLSYGAWAIRALVLSLSELLFENLVPRQQVCALKRVVVRSAWPTGVRWGKSQIPLDLIATTPGEDGEWFATAKELEPYDLAA